MHVITFKSILHQVFDEILDVVHQYLQQVGVDSVEMLRVGEQLVRLAENEKRVVWVLPSGDEPVRVVKLRKPAKIQRHLYDYVVQVRAAGRWRRLAYTSRAMASVIMRLDRPTLRVLADGELLLKYAETREEKLAVRNSGVSAIAESVLRNGIYTRHRMTLFREPVGEDELARIATSAGYEYLQYGRSRPPIYHRSLFVRSLQYNIAGREVTITVSLSENIVEYRYREGERHLTLSIT